MKKLGFVFLVSFAIVAALVTGITVAMVRGYGVSEGRYLEARDGIPIIVYENSPIVLSNEAGEKAFDDIDVGDRIFVVHDGIQESYPARTHIYAVFKLEDGNPEDIPETVIAQLCELGWLS